MARRRYTLRVGSRAKQDLRSARRFPERLIVGLVLFVTAATYTSLEYDRQRPFLSSPNDEIHLILEGRASAPAQYRIGIAYMSSFLERHCHVRPNQTIPIFQGFSLAVALGLLYFLLLQSPFVREAEERDRAFVIGLFLVAIQLPVSWIAPWAHWETLPTTLYLAATLALVTCRIRLPSIAICAGVLVLGFLQGLLRADVSTLMGVAIIAAGVLSAKMPLPMPRGWLVLTGALTALAGAGTQLYLQHFVYPATTYDAGTKKIMFAYNFIYLNPHRLVPFGLAMLPIAVTVYLVVRYRERLQEALEPTDKLVLLACALYFPAWAVMGIVGEVRIFVPYLFLAAPTMAKVWSRYLLSDVVPAA